MTIQTRQLPPSQRLGLQPSTDGAVLLPGLPTLGFGVERYVAQGGAATVFSLEPGDTLTVRDREGRQAAEIAAFVPDGAADTGALGAAATGSAEGLKAILGAENESARSLAASLRRRGLDIAAARSIDALGGESRPGDEASFTAERPLVCFVAAPGGPMRVDRQDPPTPVEIFVARANPVAPDEHPVPRRARGASLSRNPWARHRASVDRTPTAMKVSLSCRKSTPPYSRARTENSSGPVSRARVSPLAATGASTRTTASREIPRHTPRSRRLSGTTDPISRAIAKMCAVLTAA